jgi:O-antigen/teichoic acid export membrane protein
MGSHKDAHRARPRSIASVAVATVLVAGAGYVVLVLVARALGPDRYLDFSVFWAALYLGVGGIFGVQQETTRSVKTGLLARSTDSLGKRGATAVKSGLAVGVVVALLVGGSSPLWAGQVFGATAWQYVALVVLGILLYSGHAATVGALAGSGSWSHYSYLLIAESFVRLSLVGLVAAFGLSVLGFALASTIAMATWLVFLFTGPFRRAAVSRLDSGFGTSVGRILQSVVASTASAIIVTGFPLLLAVFVRGEKSDDLARIILVVTLTRAPILLPLNAFLGMIVSSFVDRRDQTLRTVLRPMLWVFVLSLALGLVAVLIGRQLLTFIFGQEYGTDAFFIGGATVAAGFVGVISISGAAALARGRHRAYTAGWLVAAFFTSVTLILPIDLNVRVLLALLTGPLVGTMVHVWALVRR